MHKVVALALMVVAAVIVGAADARTHASAGMYGVRIVNYKVNRDHTVSINVKIRGLVMGAMSKHNVAGQGHWNIYVNRKLSNYSVNARTGKTKVLRKGDYKVYVALVYNDGSPLSEPTRSKTIPVMVDA